jgi:SP family facilitated glucose transporter-like MFS transporter 1
VSPVNLRGAIGSCHQLVVTISILCAQIIGLEIFLGNERMWPLAFGGIFFRILIKTQLFLLGLTALPAVFQLICLPFCPESPKYNLIVKNRVEQAEKDLIRLRAKTDVSVEVEQLRREADAMRSVKVVRFHLFQNKNIIFLCDFMTTYDK